jgi:hypothetical protein
VELVRWSDLIEDRYSPDQPRDEDGKWTNGGGSDSSSKHTINIRDEVVNAKESLIFNAGQFVLQGGTTQAVADRQQARDLFQNMENRRERMEEDEWDAAQYDTGEQMTDKALLTLSMFGPDQVSVTAAFAPNGDVCGAMATSGIQENPAAGMKWVSLDEDGNRVEHVYEDKALFVEIIGSVHILDGVGSMFTQQAIKEAADVGVGLALQPLDDNAAKFWIDHLGMEKVAPGPTHTGGGGTETFGRDYVGWTAEEVKYLAS